MEHVVEGVDADGDLLEGRFEYIDNFSDKGQLQLLQNFIVYFVDCVKYVHQNQYTAVSDALHYCLLILQS